MLYKIVSIIIDICDLMKNSSLLAQKIPPTVDARDGLDSKLSYGWMALRTRTHGENGMAHGVAHSL